MDILTHDSTISNWILYRLCSNGMVDELKLIRKKIRLDAKRHKVDEMDLDYAVKSLICKEENRTIEAATYSDLVKEKSQHIWDVAEGTREAIREI